MKLNPKEREKIRKRIWAGHTAENLMTTEWIDEVLDYIDSVLEKGELP